MNRKRLLLWYLLCGMAVGCGHRPQKSALPVRHTVAAESDTGRNPLLTLLESLIDHDALQPDTGWKHAPDGSFMDLDDAVRIPRYGDHPDTFADFPFPDLAMTYNNPGREDGGGYFFAIHQFRIPERVYAGDNEFRTSSMVRFRYRGRGYLVFAGSLRDYTGYGDRIHFNYFFDLSRAQPVADMYENAWGFVKEPFLYGTLNDDTLLDRIRFDGIARPGLSGADTITVSAETYRNRKWQPLADGAGRRYFIRILISDQDTVIRVADHYWMKLFPVR